MAVAEPILAVDDIQGDVIAGFRKDHVRLVFFALCDDQIAQFKIWLAAYASQISSLSQVSGFNTVFKTMRLQLGREPTELSVSWRNIAFTSVGLNKLIGAAELQNFGDPSFQVGAEGLSPTLGDPADGSPGSPSTWVIGSGTNVPDGLITLAADDSGQLTQEIADLTAALGPFLRSPLHIEVGETRASMPGHEHFGFKDGVSQPAVRGTLADGNYFTPRYLDSADPAAAYLAAPGQPLVWPGEFLLNGPKQKGGNADPLQTRTVVDGPAWATNGSYLVFRRLKQNVRAFNAMLDAIHAQMAADPSFAGTGLDKVGAMVVGRYEDGCPIMRSPLDNPQLAADPYSANDFNFSTASPKLEIAAGAPVPANTFPQAPADRAGLICPWGAHIRKVNPRDDSTDFGSGSNNLQRRILRRGIPYGPEFDPANPDDADRGLLFLCYQASIEDQFQTLVTDWVNSKTAPKDPSTYDPLISTVSNRTFQVKRPDGTTLDVNIPDALVVATGAAFLFAPPISALKGRLSQ